ncbi:hypothetical protein ACHAO5_008500, partial [Verticillium nonalfalfae]
MMTNYIDRLSLAAFALLASQASITGASSMRRVTRSSSIDSPSAAGLVARGAQHEPCWSVISLNPKEHGCKAAELAVNGTCQPLTFGDALESCLDGCEPGQWCDEGKCEPIQIILDPLHCGDITPVELAPGEVCVNGIAIPLDLTEDPYVCGPGKDKTKACDPGNYCDNGVCTPITLGSSTIIVGTDPYHCGVDAATCEPGQLCVDGGCHDVAVGQPLDKCKKEDLHPGTFCWESDIVPMHISTYPGSCPEGQVSVSGVCFGDLPKTCQPQGGPGSGSGSGSSSGSSSGSGSSSSGTVKGSAQYGGWFPDAGYGSVQHNGQWYNFGRPSSCGDKSCGPNSFCCGNTCLPLGGGSEFEGCGSGCSNGEFCYRDSCRPVYIGQPGGGPDGDYVFDCPCGDTVCGPNEVCIGGAVCVDLTPGNPGSCGSYGACPPSFVCLKDTCVPGGGGGGDGEPGVCNPTCAKDEKCVDGACVPLTQPGGCDPACEGDDSCLNGVCIPPVGPGCSPACGPLSTCANGVCVPIVGPNVCFPPCDSDDTCINGVCVPDAGPACNPACSGTDTCINGVCVPVVGPVTCDPACEPGSQCVDGQCVPVVGPVTCEPSCPPGSTCVNGVCVPLVGPETCDPACTGGATCLNGVCVPPVGPVCNPTCAPGSVCVNGQCVPVVGPVTCTPACDSDEVCLNGVCVPSTNPPGTCDPACTGDDSCVNGVCVPPVDTCTPACTGLDTCINGACVPPVGPVTCDPACTGTDTCVNGVCVPTTGPVCDPPCGSGELCANGVCVPVTPPSGCNPVCGPGFVCGPEDTCLPIIDPPTCNIDPAAAVGRRQTGSCPPGTTCAMGPNGPVCVPNPPDTCTNDSECDSGEQCVEGVCIVLPNPGLCDPACTGTDTCVLGVCVPANPTCTPACTGTDTCVNGVCVPPTGPGVCEPACEAGATCVLGVCVPVTNECEPACVAPETCLNGACVPIVLPTCPNGCPAGSTCIIGVCVPDQPPTCNPECAEGSTCVLGVNGVSVCVPDVTPPTCEPECGDGFTCALGVGGVSICVPDVGPPVCTPECAEGSTCTLGLGGVGVCVPDVTPPACTPECGEGFTCVISLGGISVCIPVVVPPVCNPQCGDGFTCVISALGITVCVPDVTPPVCTPECGTGFTCSAGAGGVGICIPDVTPPVCTPECGTGFTCVIGAGGLSVCVPEISQPECNPACGTGFNCIFGVNGVSICVPDVTPPTCTPECGEGFTCALGVGGVGVCIPDTNPGCEPACSNGQTCVANTCVPATCNLPTVSGLALDKRQQGDCPEGFTCAVGAGGTGICVPTVNPDVCNPTCAAGSTCINNVCVPDTCTIPNESIGILKRQTQGTCPDGFNCVIGVGGVGACVPDLGPEVCNPVCGPGFTCVDGQCVPQTCTISIGVNLLKRQTQGDCPDGFVCALGVGGISICIPDLTPPTGCTPACTTGQTCVNNACVPQTCIIEVGLRLGKRQSQGNCPDGFLCVAAVGGATICVPDLTGPETCTPACTGDTTCVSGVCVPNTCTVTLDISKRQTQGDCPNGFNCIGSVCVPVVTPPVCSPTCNAGSTCVGGICVPNTCTLPLFRRFDKRQSQGDCPEGFVCTVPAGGGPSVCLPATTPETCNPTCAAGSLCVGTTCVPLGCTIPAPTLKMAKRQSQGTCPEGSVCTILTGDSGTCTPEVPNTCTPDCPTGTTCIAGQCLPQICTLPELTRFTMKRQVQADCPDGFTCTVATGNTGICTPTVPATCTPACGTGTTCVGTVCVPQSCTVSVAIPRAKRQVQGDCPEGFECDSIVGGVGTCQPVTQPTNCGDTGGPCTGGLICVDVDVGGISADVCILPQFCVPVLNTGCDAGETCRLQVGGGGLTACVPDTPTGLTCTPACGSTETCTAPISGTGPNTCEPNNTPANCGDTGGPCSGGLICVDVDVGGISADVCILPQFCVPVLNTGCDAGETCRLQVGGGGLTACVPDTPTGLTCTPACGSTETCTAPISGTGPNTCEPNNTPANCGDTGGPCDSGLICVDADVGGISADICILPRVCIPIGNTGCDVGETCRLQIGGGSLTACVPNTPVGLTCTPACGSTETCTAPVSGTGPNTCEPNTAPVNCGDTGGPCESGLICVDADVGGISADICILPRVCIPVTNFGCTADETCRLQLGGGSLTACVPNAPVGLTCTPACDSTETCTAPVSGTGPNTCEPNTVTPANCGDTGGPCTGGLICVEADAGGISADICILPRVCVPVINFGCDTGETCRLQLGGGSLTACVPDTPPAGLTCTPACDSGETCTAPVSGTGPNTCEPNTVTPANCGDTGGPCSGSLICVEADAGGISADICILPRVCVPVTNFGCDTGETCRLQLGGGSLTACVPDTPPAGLTCTPACDSGETCTAPVSGTGPNTCEPDTITPANCGDTGGPCSGSLICVEADVGVASADFCILPRVCTPITNFGCDTGETCRLQLGGGSLTA